MLQWDIPDRECLKLGVSCADASLVLLIKLGEADGHLAASRSGGSYHYQWAGGLDIIILPVALIAYDVGYIGRISGDNVMPVHLDAQLFQTVLEQDRAFLAAELGNDDAAYIEAVLAVYAHQPEHIGVIGDSKIPTYLILLNIFRTYYNDNLGLVGKLLEHPKLAVRLESRKNPGSMVIIEEFAAEFKIKLVVKLIDTLPDMGRLHLKVFFVVKSNSHMYTFLLLFY